MVDCSTLLQHVGIIMDGNGRWAKSRALPRSAGHLEGLTTAKRIIRAAAERNLAYITLYTFSTENWKRPSEEVSYLFGLISEYIRKEYPFYVEHNLRVRFCGDMDALPPSVADKLHEAMHFTAGHTGLQVILALNYGGRDEILRALRRFTESSGQSAAAIPDEQHFRTFLDNPDIPDPDLIIRTAGEQRLSNFLLWQSAYSELYFSDTLWPDWDETHLDRALETFSGRIRRFGGIDNEQRR